MKTNSHTSLSLALLALLTGTALAAGPVGGAVTATAGAVGSIGAPVMGGVRTTAGATVNGVAGASGVSGSAATSANGSAAGANGTLNANGAANINTAAAGTDFDTIGMRQERLQARADAAASNDVKAIGRIESSVRDTAYSDREKVDADITKSLDETKAALAADERHVSASAKTDYDASRAEVRNREAALTQSLKVAKAASKETWEASRDDVAVSYSLYATAVMRSRVIAAQGSTSASGTLDSANTVASIRSTDRAARDHLNEDIRAKLAATEKAMDATGAEAKRLGADARDSYITAAHVAAHRERAVRQTLDSAEKAADSDWARARNDVAVAYADYAEAVSRAELAATAQGTANVAENSSHLQTASNGTLVANERN